MTHIEEQLIRDYTPLLAGIARKYSFLAEYDDLFSEGVIALLIAYRGYDESEGVPLAGYLKQRVTFGVLIRARELNSPVYIPHTINATMHAIRRRGIENDTVTDISKALGLPESQVKRALVAHRNSRMSSTDAPTTEERNVLDVIEILDDYSSLSVEGFTERLTDRQRLILSHMYNQLKQSDIGKTLGISQSQVGRDIASIRKLYKDLEGMA